jgi:hypothetical protein
MNTRTATGVLAALLLAAATPAHAKCRAIVSIGVAYADRYVSVARPHQSKVLREPHGGPNVERFGGPLARVKLGARCDGFRVYLDHVSAIDSTRDAGINTLNVELDLVDYWSTR